MAVRHGGKGPGHLSRRTTISGTGPQPPVNAITDPRPGYEGQFITDPRPGYEGQYITDPRT